MCITELSKLCPTHFNLDIRHLGAGIGYSLLLFSQIGCLKVQIYKIYKIINQTKIHFVPVTSNITTCKEFQELFAVFLC